MEKLQDEQEIKALKDMLETGSDEENEKEDDSEDMDTTDDSGYDTEAKLSPKDVKKFGRNVLISANFKSTREGLSKNRPGITKKAPFSYSKTKIKDKKLRMKHAKFANNLVYAGKCGVS